MPPTTFYGNQTQPLIEVGWPPHVAPLLSQFQGAAGADDGVPVMELSATTSGDFQILGALGYQWSGQSIAASHALGQKMVV